MWLRLVRQGNQFTGYVSTNGTSWTTAGSDDDQHDCRGLRRPGGHEPRRLGNLYGDVHKSPARNRDGAHGAHGAHVAHSPTSPTTLPAPWTNRDIGGPALAGSASAAGGTFTVAAGGDNIWGPSDQFHFVYQPLQGDVEIIARVASLQYADAWSKAGVMIRESLTGSSRHAMMHVTGTEGWWFMRRIASGGESYEQFGSSGSAPGWVRLVREGNLFTAYRSTNGTTWSLVGTETIAMASTVYVGLAVTSNNPQRGRQRHSPTSRRELCRRGRISRRPCRSRAQRLAPRSPRPRPSRFRPQRATRMARLPRLISTGGRNSSRRTPRTRIA